jgi:hypothetical protein
MSSYLGKRGYSEVFVEPERSPSVDLAPEYFSYIYGAKGRVLQVGVSSHAIECRAVFFNPSLLSALNRLLDMCFCYRLLRGHDFLEVMVK